MRIQPLSAPRHDTAIAAAMRAAPPLPHSLRAASANGADESLSVSSGTRPCTTVQAVTVMIAAIATPIMVARGIVRSASATCSAGIVAHSNPSRAHNASAAVVVVTSSSPSPLGLNGANAWISTVPAPTATTAISGNNLSTVVTSCAMPAVRTPARLHAVHNHNTTSAQPAERGGVVSNPGSNAAMLPANATAMAATAHQVEIQ